MVVMALVSLISVALLISGIILIKQSIDAIREKQIDLFDEDERQWNETFRSQFMAIDINVVKDYPLYNLTQLELAEAEE